MFAIRGCVWNDFVMSTVQEAEKLLSRMSRAEKAELLQLVVRSINDASGGADVSARGDDVPGIESSPDVCGGEPRIVRTRIPVWVLEQARRLGATESELLRMYPALRAEDLVNAWAYVSLNRDEIDRQIRENEAA